MLHYQILVNYTPIDLYYTSRRIYLKLTRFEKARIIGARALQITMGAPVLTKIPKDMYDPITIAYLEFEKDVIPITVLRA